MHYWQKEKEPSLPCLSVNGIQRSNMFTPDHNRLKLTSCDNISSWLSHENAFCVGICPDNFKPSPTEGLSWIKHSLSVWSGLWIWLLLSGFIKMSTPREISLHLAAYNFLAPSISVPDAIHIPHAPIHHMLFTLRHLQYLRHPQYLSGGQ